MDSLYQKSTLDIPKIAERCVAGYETNRRTELSIGDTTSFGVEGMGDHSSDADDEITDVSGENRSCSPEICDSSKQYYVLSGTKPFSLVIRRCSTPTTESKSFLKRDSSVSPFTREFEKTSKSEILNSDRKVNGSFLHQRTIDSCNPVSSQIEECGDVSRQPVSGGTVRSLQEVSLNTPKESNDSVVTQEYTENVMCGNALHIGVTTIPSAENHVQLNYTDDSAFLQSQHMFKNCCSDSTDGNCFLPLCCSTEKCGRLNNDSIDDRNQYSSLLLGNPKNTQSSMNVLPSDHSKQEVEPSIYNSVLKVQEEDSNAGLTRGGECQAMEAADNINHEAKISADVIFDTDSFHMREHSESAEQMAVLNIQSEFVTVGDHTLKSNIIEASLNKVCEGDELAIVDESLTFENSELTLLEIQGGNVSELGNQNEGCNEVKAVVSHDVVVTVDRNTFDEVDHIFSGRKQDEWKKTEVTLDVSKTAVQNDTVKSETENEIGCEPALMQESYYTSEEIKISVLQNCSVVNTVSNASETISLTPFGHQESASGVGNSENTIPVIHTENRQTLPVEDDNFVQKRVECSCGDENEGSETESGLCLTHSPRDLVPPVDVDCVLITDVIAKDVPVSVKAEVIKNSVCNSALEDELAENVIMGGVDCHLDEFCTTSKADNLQSQDSILVQPRTEDALDSDIPSDTVHIERSPLLFSSDDDNSYYTETVICEQEVTAATTYYDEALTTEQKKLHRLQEALLGVPPPPSVTIPQHDVADILRLWKENKSLMISADSESEAGAGAVKSEAVILKQSHLERMKNSCWPESKYYSCYGIHYNRGQISEEFEILCQRLQERCVGSETTSSCNIWFKHDISNKVHHVNSRRRNTGHSPGSRLSHLARRRRTFSSADLCNNSVAGQLPGKHHSSAVERRLIMVDLKKTEHRQRPRSYQPHKQVPSVDRTQLQQTKRALFKSPPSNHERIYSAMKSRSGSKRAKSDTDRTRIENSKRALGPCTSKNNVAGKTGYDGVQTSLSGESSGFGKRKREEQGMLTPHNTCARKLLFGDAAAVKGKRDSITGGDNIQRLRTGENKPQMSVSRDMTGGLSEVQRKKLLWAVAEALRAEGISMSHPLFRPYATSLARLVRNVMPDLNCRRTFSTSDLMLQLAKQYIGDVMKEDQNGQTTINSRT